MCLDNTEDPRLPPCQFEGAAGTVRSGLTSLKVS